MIKKYKDYIILLIVFLIIIFGSNISNIFMLFDTNLKLDNITNTYCKSVEQDYNALLDSNSFQLQSNLNLIISKVMLRDIYEYKDTLKIYKGSSDKITEGMAVIVDNGLVGIIEDTKKNYSTVRLITNKNSNISVRIKDYYGILKMSDNRLVVSDLNNYNDINVGDLIYTSGIGNVTGDLYVGKVKEIRLNNTEIGKNIIVELDYDIDNLNYLFIVS